MKVLFELMKCIKDQLTRAKHASRSAAEASDHYLCCQIMGVPPYLYKHNQIMGVPPSLQA